MSDLTKYGEWALITGASAGIGREFARAIAAGGVNCAIVARRADRLSELAQELEQTLGIECLPIPQDLSVEGCVDEVMTQIGDRGIGILVNNAGFGHSGEFVGLDPSKLANMVKLNCLTPTLLTRALAPGMVERKSGAIIMVSSLAGFCGAPYQSVYGATKAFDLSLGDALHVELRKSGVDVITLCPAHTDTEFFEAEGLAEDVIQLATKTASSPEHVVDLTLRKLGRASIATPTLAKVSAFAFRGMSRRVAASLMGAGIKKGFDIQT